MELIQIILLSIIQGITEFLPISSSAHLILLPELTEFKDQGLIIDIAVHIGTLLAVLLYYRKDTTQIFSYILNPDSNKKESKTLFFKILIAFMPIIIAGLALFIIQPVFIRQKETIAITSIIFGIVLYIMDKYGEKRKDINSLGYLGSLKIGIAQCLALIPGVSRSGITITEARRQGLTREEAVHFSMLLSIPTIAAAGIISFAFLITSSTAPLITTLQTPLTAIALSFISSYIVLTLFIKWVQNYSMTIFAVYRIILGIIILI